MDQEKYIEIKNKTKDIFIKNPSIQCPYFGQEVTLNSDGFHHLQFSSRRERDKNEQILKFNLVPLAIKIIRKTSTLQEYRKNLIEDGNKSQRDGLTPLKLVEYWGFVAIVGEKHIRVRVILRRTGNGKIIFWSVMPAMKLSRDEFETRKNLAKKGIEDD